MIIDKRQTPSFFMYNARLMVTRSGSLATISCELRQVRKEATVTVISGAEVRLGRVTTLFSFLAVIELLSSLESIDDFII
jgi:hypothetical protein